MDFRDIKEFLHDTFKYIIVFIVALIIVIYVVGFHQIIGPSMEPTLYENNVTIVNKVKYIILEPKRFEVIVLQKDNRTLIKRVIGLPGEYIEYINNQLYINNQYFEETFINNQNTEYFNLKDIGHNIIPEDMYLVMGDNREDSLDGRVFGLITKEEIIGKVSFVIWPINAFKIVK